MPLEDSPYLQGMRRKTLDALRYADGGVADSGPSWWDRLVQGGEDLVNRIRQGPGVLQQNPLEAPQYQPSPAQQANRARVAQAAQAYDEFADKLIHLNPAAAPPDMETATQNLIKSRLPAAPPLPRKEIHDVALAHQVNPETPLGNATASGLASAFTLGTPWGQGVQTALNPRGALQAEAPLVGIGGGGGLGDVAPPEQRIITPSEEPMIVSPQPGQLVKPATPRDMEIATRASLGPGGLSPAEVAAAKSRQIQEMIRRPAPPEATAAEPQGRDVLARSVEDLERRIPNSQRVVSPDATRLINGQPFSTLDVNAPSEGYLPFQHLGPEEANNLNNGMWQDAIRESELPGGSAAMDAVRKTGARPPTAEFLHRAMQLPQRARYWYELSGDSFTGDHMDIPRELQPGFIDNVAATSGGAKPYGNLKRALGSYAENLQNLPIYTDLRDPASVRNALNPELQGLGTHKYRNFSGTMQYTSGLGDQPPLSVNDVQMADIFGIKGSDIGKNPALYEVMSRYINKVRDAQNHLLPDGAQPWETWQIQAPAWVRQRLDKDPKSTYDDYAMVFPKIIQELNDAGVPTPNGKITMDTLMDPRTPNVMSSTREQFMGTPTGTVEFATTKTPAGATAAQTRAQLEQLDPNLPWVQKAKAKYEQIQRNAMQDFAMRHDNNPSLVSQLMSEITGQKLDVSRLEWNGYGTYEGDINPNLRIPMGGAGSKGFVALTKPQREAFLSMLGQDLNQDGMAASHFTTVPHEPAGQPPSADRTYSVWMRRYDNQVDQRAVQEFSRQLGYPVNVSRTPNGILIDVNIADKGVGPTHEAVKNAADATFGNDPNVHDLGTIPRSYASDFVHNSDYQEKIDAQMQGNKPGRGGPAWNPKANLRNIKRIRQAIQQIAQERDAEFADWHNNTQASIANPPKVKQSKAPPEAVPQ